MKRSKSNAKFGYKKRITTKIQRELAIILRCKFDDPLFMNVTIIRVEVSADSSHAKVFFVTTDAQIETTIAALNEEAPALQHSLAQNLNLRKTPKLRFIYDESIERGRRLTALIEETKNEK